MPETSDLLAEPIKRVLSHFDGQPLILAEFVETLEKHVHFLTEDGSTECRDNYMRFIRSWVARVVYETDD